MRFLVALALVATGVSAATAQDTDPRIDEIRGVWEACTAMTESDSGWVGWHRDFFNGYGDDFEFYDGRWSGEVSVLKRAYMIDAIAYEEVTSCFRADGSLAFIFTSMTSPNMGEGGEEGPAIVREGRIYFSEDGEAIRLLGQIADPDGNRLGDIDAPGYQLARGCSPVTVHRQVDAVETEYFSVLGDITGEHPEFVAEELDWCATLSGTAG